MKIGLFLLALGSTTLSFSQNSIEKPVKEKVSSKNELHFSFSNLNPTRFGLQYKRQFANNKYLKFGLTNINLGYRHQAESISFGGQLEAGVEFRTALSKRFSLYHGPSLRFGYNTYRSTGTTTGLIPVYPLNHYSISIPYTIGVQFNVTNKFGIGLESSPGINANFQKIGNNFDLNNVNAGFGGEIGRFSLIYRF